jgi:hypothetical protein
VVQHEGVVFRGQQGIDCHRHDPGVQRAEKGHHPVAAVVHEQEHPVFAAQAQGLQAGGQTLHLLGQLAVAQAGQVVGQRGLGAAGRVEVDQVPGEVEPGGRWQDIGVHGVGSGAFQQAAERAGRTLSGQEQVK